MDLLRVFKGVQPSCRMLFRPTTWAGGGGGGGGGTPSICLSATAAKLPTGKHATRVGQSS